MEKQKSIKKNIIMSIILTSANFVFPLITYSYVARILMPAGTGKVAFVQSIMSYFGFIASLGISGYGMRECAKVREDKEALSKLVHELIMINFSSTIVAYIALAAALAAVPKFQSYLPLFVIMSSSMLLQSLGMEWLYQALEQYSYITVRSLIFKTISVILTFLLIKSPDDYVIYGGLTIFTSSASNILNFYHARKYVFLNKFNGYELRKHLKPVFVFFMSSMIITIYSHFDSTMLGFMKGDSEVGIYNSALKMKTIVLSLSSGVTSVLVPRMSLYIGKKQKGAFLDLLMKSLRVTMILVLPLVVFVLINGDNVLTFVCGTGYLSAKPTLSILMLCVLVLCMTNLFGNQVLIPKGLERYYSISVFIGLFINLGLNGVLIPEYASAGAAGATLVTECFNMIYMGAHCREEVKHLRKNIGARKYMVSVGLAVAAEIALIPFTCALPVFVLLSINLAAFFGVYMAVLIVFKEPVVMGLIIQLRSVCRSRSRRND